MRVIYVDVFNTLITLEDFDGKVGFKVVQYYE